MRVSIVICTHNQCQRLRLVLRALSVQTRMADEIVVVDDASTDETAVAVNESRARLTTTALHYISLPSNVGSPRARNVGVAASTGALVIFLDADALPSHTHVEDHLALQQARGPCLAFGPLWHTVTTEFFRDPIRGLPFDVDIPEPVQRLMQTKLAALLIREDDVVHRFPSIIRRSRPGTYPGLQWMEQEGIRLGDAAGHPAAWVLMTPQNVSVPRAVLDEVGGFDGTLPFCEGWDLALRVRSSGFPLLRVAAAPIYHLYHYRPLGSFAQQTLRWQAMQRIARKQNQQALLIVLLAFALQGNDPFIPRELGPLGLDHLADLFARYDGEAMGPYGTILARHPAFGDFSREPC